MKVALPLIFAAPKPSLKAVPPFNVRFWLKYYASTEIMSFAAPVFTFTSPSKPSP